MADVKINRTHIKVNEGGSIDATAMTASNTYYLDLRGGDYKTVFVFTNTNATQATVTVAIGDGLQGVGDPIVLSVAQNKTVPLVVDSGAYKLVSGENKGYAKVTVSSGCSVAVVELP